MSAETLSPRKTLLLILCLGLFQCAVFSAVARYFGPDANAAVPQPDTLLFQQYAKSMAEGHPYRFNAQDARSTGSTSHLYPAILALFYKLGARGDSLAGAGFVFNSLCYLVFILLFWDVARRLAPDAALWATLLCILSGQTVFTALGQTDMGLFMAVSWAVLAAALRGRYKTCGVLLFVAVWTRPEGAILAFVLAAVAAAYTRLGGRSGMSRLRSLNMLLAGLVGLLGLAGVFTLNHWLTGRIAFDSVLGKSPGLYYPFGGILLRVAESLGEMVQEVLFGLGAKGRPFYAIPVLGGILGLAGLLSRDWKNGRDAPVEIWWLAAVAGSVGLVAMSDWQGVQYDRYLGWSLPTAFLYIVLGARSVCSRFSGKLSFGVLAGGLLAYQLVGLAYFTAVYAADCASMASNIEFAKKVNDKVPKNSKIGIYGYGGLVYYMPDQTTVNINGITSPDFTRRHFFMCNLALLKHRPDLRFDRWLISPTDATMGWFAGFVGGQIASASPALGSGQLRALYHARWDLFEYPPGPLTAEALEAVRGLSPIDSLDVGHTDDEKRCDYTYYTRIRGAKLHPFVKTGEIAGRTIADLGRVIYGNESFKIHCAPGKPIRVVMRVCSKATVFIAKPKQGLKGQDFEFAPPLRLLVFVNDDEVGEFSFDVDPESGDFHEVILDLPQTHVTGEEIQITVGGDHMVLGYWFYQ